MEERLHFGDLIIIPIDSERSTHFKVMRGEDYLFRLVPCMEGFELSALDQCLGNELDYELVEKVGLFIHDHYA
ncbi:MAG: hypothetical protein E6K54_08995 [Gammaproteobacteria bacterium]|nr:MAG: hypothetical protein E6K54_08995 [Gammaproteobacteria bacterium]